MLDAAVTHINMRLQGAEPTVRIHSAVCAVPPSLLLTLWHAFTQTHTIQHTADSCLNSPCTVRKAYTAAPLWTSISTAPYSKAGQFNDGNFIICCDSLSWMPRPYCVLWADGLFLSLWSPNIHNPFDKISILKVRWEIYHHFSPQSGFISFHHRAQGHMGVLGETCWH